MELDEFKERWNKLSDVNLKSITHTTTTIETIIMNTTNTLNQLQQKNQSWKSQAMIIFPILTLILSIYAYLNFFKPNTYHTIAGALCYITIIVLTALVSNLMYSRQDRIFKSYNTGNLKNSLRGTITAFEKFYTLYNIVNLFVFPSFFYALFQLSVNLLKMTQGEILFTSVLLSGISFGFSHVYYKLTYFRKINSLKRDLEELNRGV